MVYVIDGRYHQFNELGVLSEELSTLQWDKLPRVFTFISAVSRDQSQFSFTHTSEQGGEVGGWWYRDLDNPKLKIFIIND